MRALRLRTPQCYKNKEDDWLGREARQRDAKFLASYYAAKRIILSDRQILANILPAYLRNGVTFVLVSTIR